MNKQHLTMLGLILGGSLAIAACSDSKSTSDDSDAGAPGEAGATGDAGAKGDAGSTSDAGAAGEAPTPVWLNPQDVVVVGAAPATFSQVLVGGTDFATQSEVASVDIESGKVLNAETYSDGDVAVLSSAGLGFALERTNDQVHLLEAGKIKTSFDLRDLGTDVVTKTNKAYVPVLNQSLIVVLDLAKGTVSHRIDLGEFVDPSDSDLSADPFAGVYDAKKGVVYFLLQRIDIATYDASFHLPCSGVTALIVGIDVATDKVVDLNGDTDGVALELSLANPNSISLNAAGTQLTVLANGCYAKTVVKQKGIEVLDLTTGKTGVVYEDTSEDYLGKLIPLVDSNVLLNTGIKWFHLDLALGTLGTELENVPSSPSFDGKDLIGVGTGSSVVRYDLTAGTSTTISETSWAGDYSFAAGTALVE